MYYYILFMCLYLRLLKQNSVVGGILLPISPFIFLKDNNLGLCDVFWSSVGHLRCLCSRRAVAEKSVGAPTSPPRSDHARRIRRCNVTWRHTLCARSTTPHRIQHPNLYILSREGHRRSLSQSSNPGRRTPPHPLDQRRTEAHACTGPGRGSLTVPRA